MKKSYFFTSLVVNALFCLKLVAEVAPLFPAQGSTVLKLDGTAATVPGTAIAANPARGIVARPAKSIKVGDDFCTGFQEDAGQLFGGGANRWAKFDRNEGVIVVTENSKRIGGSPGSGRMGFVFACEAWGLPTGAAAGTAPSKFPYAYIYSTSTTPAGAVVPCRELVSKCGEIAVSMFDTAAHLSFDRRKIRAIRPGSCKEVFRAPSGVKSICNFPDPSANAQSLPAGHLVWAMVDARKWPYMVPSEGAPNTDMLVSRGISVAPGTTVSPMINFPGACNYSDSAQSRYCGPQVPSYRGQFTFQTWLGQQHSPVVRAVDGRGNALPAIRLAGTNACNPNEDIKISVTQIRNPVNNPGQAADYVREVANP